MGAMALSASSIIPPPLPPPSVLWNGNESCVLPLQTHQQVTDVCLIPSDGAWSQQLSNILNALQSGL